MTDALITYGAKLDSQQLETMLAFLFESNIQHEKETGQRPTPICVWGTHGIGKTHLSAGFARERGWKVAYCAPAQFEEMGDLHGLPIKMDPDPDVRGDEYTVYLPPDWVPTEEGPGILLLDDFNRADDRILRGIMQLLQNFELFSWTLPPKWQIVCTANPEGGDYSVTPLDDAMLTRMIHATMVFDAKAWAAWATKNGVDPRGVAFVLTYPETVTGQRTTPRSLTQFFGFTARYTDLKAHAEAVYRLGLGCLDSTTVSAFMAFVNDELGVLIDPQELLEAKPFAPMQKKVMALAEGKGGAKRIDRLATLCTRIVLYLCRDDVEPTDVHKANLIAFLLIEAIPTDLRFSVHRDLTVRGKADLLRDPRLAKLILAGM